MNILDGPTLLLKTVQKAVIRYELELFVQHPQRFFAGFYV
jgi:hypothetical protein